MTSFMEIFVLKPFVVGKLSLFSGMKNDTLMHREGFGLNLIALHYTTFHPLEVVSHCRSPQL